MTDRTRGHPYAWETQSPWPHRPCRNCYARGMAAPFAERWLVVYADCPLCLGSGVEPPGTDSNITTDRGEA